MSPMIGAAAVSLSSFTVCMNALRLNLFNVHDDSHDKPLKKRALPEEKKTVPTVEEAPAAEEKTETLLIEGMMCEHCEASVKKALLKIDGIENAEVSHTAGTAVITLSKDVDETVIKEAIEDRDYKYLGIE